MIYPNLFTIPRLVPETDGEIPLLDEDFDEEFGFDYETGDDFAQEYDE